MTRVLGSLAFAAAALCASLARGDDAATARQTGETSTDDLELRLTLSSFLYRESGADAPALVEQGAALPNASPVRRSFGDLRTELSVDGLSVDARIRQTTSGRYQAGAASGGEYEVRTVAYRAGSPNISLAIGRQAIDAVGATRVDGLALTHTLTTAAAATLFAGAYPVRGSRSLDTDYVHARGPDGSPGPLLVPVIGGLGADYRRGDLHGDLGVAVIRVVQDVPGASAGERSRVFSTSSGYWRIAAPLEVYHVAELDVSGPSGVRLTSGSLGIDGRPSAQVQLGGSLHHASTDLLEITARNLLRDPDPSAAGVVQNHLAVLRISQDVARVSASVALAARRFELSVSGGVHRRPGIRVTLADGVGAVVFPEARSADATLAILDRHSIAGLRVQLSGTLTRPLGDSAASRARGTVVRLGASRTFAGQRGQVEADVMAERFRDVSASGGVCMTSLAVFSCYGNSTTVAVQAGAVASWRVGREWLVLGDIHVGSRDVQSTSLAGPITWPSLRSVTSFVRVQWRYR